MNEREKGWRSGETTRLPPMWPGFESWCRRHMWGEFVVGSLPCSERFFSGYSGFLCSKSQFDLERTDTFQRVLYERKYSVGKQITFTNEGTNEQTNERMNE